MRISDTAKRFAKNAGWMMAVRIYSMLLSLVVGSISARYLGPENYGLINYGTSLIAFFSTICQLGLDGIIINELIKDPKNRGAYLGTAFVMRFLTSICSLFVILAVIRILEPNNTMLHIIVFLQSFAVVFQGYEVFNYWFQVELKIKYVSVASMIALTIVSVWKISLLVTQKTVYYFALSNSIQNLVCGLVVIFCFAKQRDSDLRLKVDWKLGGQVLSKSYHFIISGLAVTLYTQIDKVMLGKMLSSEAVGIYAAASTISVLWEFVPMALINSANPIIIKKKSDNDVEYIKWFEYLLLGISFMSLFVSIMFCIFGKLAIWILYGEAYLQAAKPLAIHIWSTGFAMIGTARSTWIIAEGYYKQSKYFVVIGCIVNVILNYYGIQHWGVIGAALATLVSQFVVAFIAPLMFKTTRRFFGIYMHSFSHIPEFVRIILQYIGKKRL